METLIYSPCYIFRFFSSILLNLSLSSILLCLQAHVLRVKSAESLPFPLILMTFIVTLQWALYGVILKDPIIQVNLNYSFRNKLTRTLLNLKYEMFVVLPFSFNRAMVKKILKCLSKLIWHALITLCLS